MSLPLHPLLARVLIITTIVFWAITFLERFSIGCRKTILANHDRHKQHWTNHKSNELRVEGAKLGKKSARKSRLVCFTSDWSKVQRVFFNQSKSVVKFLSNYFRHSIDNRSYKIIGKIRLADLITLSSTLVPRRSPQPYFISFLYSCNIYFIVLSSRVSEKRTPGY